MASARNDDMKQAGRRKRARLALWAIVVWLVVWQAASWLLASELLLPGPVDVLVRFAELAFTAEFWQRVLFSAARILGGVVIGCLVGALFAGGAMRFRRVEELIAPLMALMRSVPVASFTVLALIWLSASNLAVLVVALVVAPVVYENLISGLASCDRQRKEMADVFDVGRWRAFRLITLPQLLPYLQAAAHLGLGMGWKAGVAAEVIGIPFGSLGEAIFTSKVHFSTVDLFAWTLAVVLLSVICERVITWALVHAARRLSKDAHASKRPGEHASESQHAVQTDDSAGSCDPVPQPERSPAAAPWPDMTGTGLCELRVSQVTRGFDNGAGPRDVSFTARVGTPLCLAAPSGYGKTTLLRIIAGLETPDSGSLVTDPHKTQPIVSMVFQENRLCPQANALDNVRIGLAHKDAAWAEAPAMLAQLGLSDVSHQAADTCSGGQQRRIALARALLAPHDVLLLDEPFTGLDDEARENAAALIRQRENGRIVIIASHDARDAELLGAHIVELG